MSRIPYIFMFFISSIFAILMSLYGEREFGLEFYHTHVCHADQCQGNGSVFRVSLCLFIFEAVHVVVVSKAVAFHHMFFPIKSLIFVVMLVCSFTIDGLNPMFDNWGETARFFSGIYLLIQILIFVSWSYDLNEYLRVRGDQIYEFEEEHEYSHKCCCGNIPGNRYHWTLGVISVGCLIATFVCLVLFYPLFDSNDTNPHCGIHESVTSVSIIVSALTIALSVVRGDGSFGVATMCSFYATFLLFNAMNADPDPEGEASCKPFHRDRDGPSLWIGFLVTLASLCYAALRSNMIALLGDDSVFIGSENDSADPNDKESRLLEEESDRAAEITLEIDDDDGDEVEQRGNYEEEEVSRDVSVDEGDAVADAQMERRTNVYFHVVMMLASAYMAMLFTNWGTNKDTIQTMGTISFSVGVISSWTVFIAFWWTLFAPHFFPERFGESE